MNMNAPHTADLTDAEESLKLQESQSVVDSSSATEVAMQNTLLTPRFYTTDFDELDAIDVSGIREEWDALIAQMVADPNKGHFKKNEDWDTIDWEGMDPALKKEFIDFLISSCTAEFSGCVLYKEMKRRGNNKDITQLFQLMARDEAKTVADFKAIHDQVILPMAAAPRLAPFRKPRRLKPSRSDFLLSSLRIVKTC